MDFKISLKYKWEITCLIDEMDFAFFEMSEIYNRFFIQSKNQVSDL